MSEDSFTIKEVVKKNIGIDVTAVSTQQVRKANIKEKRRILLVKFPTIKDKGQTLKSADKLGEKAETKRLFNQDGFNPTPTGTNASIKRRTEPEKQKKKKKKQKKNTVADPDNWKIHAGYCRWEVVHRPPNPEA